MDAKMSEAEQVMRDTVKAQLADRKPGGPIYGMVELKTVECMDIIAELDRLREFAREVDRIRESWAGTNEAIDLELRDAIARAKGGEAT